MAGAQAKKGKLTTADSIAIVAVADRFHRAVKTGDTLAVTQLLANDLQVLEGGDVENRDHYISHHLPADIEFARATTSTRTISSLRREGKVAWLVSTSATRGTFRGREINSVGAEMMILTRTKNDWRIRAVQWSSGRAQPPTQPSR